MSSRREEVREIAQRAGAGTPGDETEVHVSYRRSRGVKRLTRADLEPLATKAEMRWMFGFQAALILAIAGNLFGFV